MLFMTAKVRCADIELIVTGFAPGKDFGCRRVAGLATGAAGFSGCMPGDFAFFDPDIQHATNGIGIGIEV